MRKNTIVNARNSFWRVIYLTQGVRETLLLLLVQSSVVGVIPFCMPG